MVVQEQQLQINLQDLLQQDKTEVLVVVDHVKEILGVLDYLLVVLVVAVELELQEALRPLVQ